MQISSKQPKKFQRKHLDWLPIATYARPKMGGNSLRSDKNIDVANHF